MRLTGLLGPILPGLLGGNLEATFGYENQTGLPVTLPLGSSNRLLPLSLQGLQPVVLSVGRHSDVVVTGSGLGPISWVLDGATVTATVDSNPC